MVDLKGEIADTIGGIFTLIAGLAALVLVLIGAYLVVVFVLYTGAEIACWLGSGSGCEAIQSYQFGE